MSPDDHAGAEDAVIAGTPLWRGASDHLDISDTASATGASHRGAADSVEVRDHVSLGASVGFGDFLRAGVELSRERRQLHDEFTAEKRDELLAAIEQNSGGGSRRAEAELNYYLAMFQTNSAERGGRRLAIATWVLALATLCLVAGTAVLAYYTATTHH